MSTDSALILFRERLPSRVMLEQQLGSLGYQVDLGKFDLESSNGWIDIRVDGRKTGFDYGLFPLTPDDFGPFPKTALQVGDTSLSFGARGMASVVAVSAVQHAISSIADAHGLIEDSLVTPLEMQTGNVQSIALFRSISSAQGGILPEADEMSTRMAEFRSSIPRLLIIVAIAAVAILAVPHLITLIAR